jgi:hypothetical protein
LPWLNHGLNANFNLTDAGGPLLRGVVMASCNGSFLAYNLTALKPFLRTILQGARVPSPEELPSIPEDPKNPGISCGPK